MCRFVGHKLRRKTLFAALICGLVFILAAHAGIRGPGRYSGVVVFDRWGTCFLLSGPYITYISDAAKNRLRPYQGTAIQVDASDVFQPLNPGDALIRKYEIIGPPPDTRRWAILDGLDLVVKSDFGPHGSPTIIIEIRNDGNKTTQVDSSDFGPTLLGLKPKATFCPSDGKSEAWITRGDLVHPSSWKSASDGVKDSASYTIDSKNRPPKRFQLAPGQSKQFRITFKASPGQYQFMVGYGGGVHEEKSLASNAISFDLNTKGFATLSKPEISASQ